MDLWINGCSKADHPCTRLASMSGHLGVNLYAIIMLLGRAIMSGSCHNLHMTAFALSSNSLAAAAETIA